MKTSWERVLNFDEAQAAYKDRKNNERSRFTYALDRVASQLGALQKKTQARMTDFEIANCETKEPDGKGAIVRDAEGRLTFTRENLLKVNAEKAQWVKAFNLEIEPYFAGALPDDLTYGELLAFSEFVIKSEDVARLVAELEDRLLKAETKSTETKKETTDGSEDALLTKDGL